MALSFSAISYYYSMVYFDLEIEKMPSNGFLLVLSSGEIFIIKKWMNQVLLSLALHVQIK